LGSERDVPVADLEGAQPEIYHIILIKLKISDPKYLIFGVFLKGGFPSPEPPPPNRNFWIRHCVQYGCTNGVSIEPVNSKS
jgi:hypothetical protein